MKSVAILQSNYIPWKGYFDLIASVDEFILYDDMQFTRRDWRNRNQIKSPRGIEWLTIPVRVKGKYHQKIRETEVEGSTWANAHWRALVQNYRKAPCFDVIADWLEPYYLEPLPSMLSDVNRRLIEAICNYLGIPTLIRNSWDYGLVDGKSERLADLCVQAGERIDRALDRRIISPYHSLLCAHSSVVQDVDLRRRLQLGNTLRPQSIKLIGARNQDVLRDGGTLLQEKIEQSTVSLRREITQKRRNHHQPTMIPIQH